MKKRVFVLLLILALVATFALAACNPDDPFENPGDKLGGGGKGQVADAVDTTTQDETKDATKDNSELTESDRDTSTDGATKIQPTTEIVEISKEGAYLFEGEYGGIAITKKVSVHLIFNGVTITREGGVAVDGTEKSGTAVVITVTDGSTNTVVNYGDDVNAIHVKGALTVNGKGTLNVTSDSKSAIKAKNTIKIVDATLNLNAANHAITGSSVIAADCKINVTSAGKDGINAECDDYAAQANFTDDGFVSLTNVNYSCDVKGDGIQANTVVYINGGTYDIKTTGEFVQKTNQNMQDYGLKSGDFKYVKSGSDYKRIASDEASRYGSNLYGLTQGCKGIKISEIEYTVKDDEGNKTDVTVYDADYLIVIEKGTFTIDSTDDAIHTNYGDVLIEGGNFEISTNDDGITSDVLTKITGGNITITKSYEGIEGAFVEISGGVIDIVSDDDGINAACDKSGVVEHIIISGGDVTVNSGGDGIDSNGSILIAGGKVVVHGPSTGGDAGLDADNGIVVNGGILFASSTLGMVETPATNSKQCVVSYAQNSEIAVGSKISLRDSKGNVLIEIEVKKSKCQSIILSCPELTQGSKYSIYSDNKKLETFTVSSIITSIGVSTQGGPGRPGGFGGPGGRP